MGVFGKEKTLDERGQKDKNKNYEQTSFIAVLIRRKVK